MFINKNAFKKLVKEADKTAQLTIIRDKDTLLVAGSAWAILVKVNMIPKEIKAILVEYIGDIPTEPESFKVHDGVRQEILQDEAYLEAFRKFKIEEREGEEYEDYYQTHVIIQGEKNLRVLQAMSGKTKLVQEKFISMIDMSVLQVNDGETMPTDLIEQPVHKLTMQNNVMQLWVFEVIPAEKEEIDEKERIIRSLEKIDMIKIDW